MKKILITGGTGFIGRNIRESYLADRYELLAPSRHELDCSDDESVALYFSNRQFDAVIHSAVKPGHRNASDTQNLFFTNSRMIFNLLHHRDRFGKFINMGSGAIYDMRHYQPKMREDYFGRYIPADEHGYNKYLLGKLIPGMLGVYDFRIFGIFGKYEDYAIRFISNAICKAIFGMPITLRQNRLFDYLYIDDLYPILEHFIEYDVESQSVNVTPDEAVGLLTIAEWIREVSGKDLMIKVGAEGMGTEYSGDNGLLRSIMPKLALTPLRTAVSELYSWYSHHTDSIDRSLLTHDK